MEVENRNDLSEYERRRLENILRNNAVLADLAIEKPVIPKVSSNNLHQY